MSRAVQKEGKKNDDDTRRRAQRAVARRGDRFAAPRAQSPLAQAGNRAIAKLAGGELLDPRVRAEMQARFGADFGSVRIHDDARDHEAADALQANAFTIGDHIVFNTGRFEPDSAEGKRLLAHELAHVVQQRRGGPAPELSPDAAHESSADQAAAQVAAGAPSVSVQRGTAVGIARNAVLDENRQPASPPVAEQPDPEKIRDELILSLWDFRFHRYRGYKALLNRGELGLLRPGNVSTGGVDAITVKIEAGKAKIFLNDFTSPGIAKPSKATHDRWRTELTRAAAGDRLNFGDRAIDNAVRAAIRDGEIYVRAVRIQVPDKATPGPRPGAGTAAAIVELGRPRKL